VNFHVNFNVLLSIYIIHPLVKMKNTLIVSRCTVKPREKNRYVKVYILNGSTVGFVLLKLDALSSKRIKSKFL